MNDFQIAFDRTKKETEENWAKKKAALLLQVKKRADRVRTYTEQGMVLLKEMGLKTEPLAQRIEKSRAAEKQTLDVITKKYASYKPSLKRVPASVSHAAAIRAAALPTATRTLPPYAVMCFSTKDPSNQSCGGTGTDIPNNYMIDSYLYSVGDAEFTIHWDFLYYFTPAYTRQYDMTFDMTFHGSYRLHTRDDPWGFFGSINPSPNNPFARVTIACETDLQQDGQWRGGFTSRIFEEATNSFGENINHRFDGDRKVSRSFFLSGGLLAEVRNRIYFTVHSEGEDSAADLDYGTGEENFLSAPFVHIQEPIADICNQYCAEHPGTCP